jgi:hypothetical protein
MYNSKSIVMRKIKTFSVPALIVCILSLIVFPGCKKTVEPSSNEGEIATKRKPHNPPPPPPAFSFACYNPTMSGTFSAGVPTNVTVTMNYFNSPGGSHNGYTSATVNGITFTTPPGTLNVGSGSIIYTASGTPLYAGQMSAIVGLDGFPNVGCNFVIHVLNAPANCGTSVDPGPTSGSTGCVTFMYRGQQVSYTTVRADDGRIWLQQNLGSPQVAYSEYDQASYGHYFQWGRWDDGHQVPTSAIVAGSASLRNPSHIPSGNPNYIYGSTPETTWWGIGGSASDTWNGTTASSTNGKDPCAALGAGWRLPTAAEWNTVSFAEDLFGTIGAAMSNLKLPASANRGALQNAEVGYYWTSTAADNGTAKLFFFDNLYQAGVVNSSRAEGAACRCIKD